MRQYAPYPTDLAEIVAACSYREHEGWRVHLLDDAGRDKDERGDVIGGGMTLRIATCGFDSYHPDRGPGYRVHHDFIVPAATYSRADWTRWVFDQFCKVEIHEAMEHFLVDGARPFPPTHGAGRDPYIVREYVDETDRSTRYNAHIRNPA